MIDLGTPERDKYCEGCGSKLTRRETGRISYNISTGSRIIWYDYACPNWQWWNFFSGHTGRTDD